MIRVHLVMHGKHVGFILVTRVQYKEFFKLDDYLLNRLRLSPR